jgi:hypothetical protein
LGCAPVAFGERYNYYHFRPITVIPLILFYFVNTLFFEYTYKYANMPRFNGSLIIATKPTAK